MQRAALAIPVNGLTNIGLKMIRPLHPLQIKLQTITEEMAPTIILDKVVRKFVHSLDPAVFHRTIEVCYEGIDCACCCFVFKWL